MTSSNNKPPGGNTALRALNPSPVSVLEKVRKAGRVWADLCEQYGVDNPDPPWKVSLEGTCNALAATEALPWLERRGEEDDLSETIYSDVPFPERQLLALAHSMIHHGLVDEDGLARKIEEVGRRLKSV
ncbi:MAG: hypothetical protein KGJ12_01460 [Gammaproteobacteria bacterium]|nr:hypothetical protein [Gammaproteobacteria bacterium]